MNSLVVAVFGLEIVYSPFIFVTFLNKAVFLKAIFGIKLAIDHFDLN